MQFESVIKSERKWYELNLKEVYRYKDLIWLFTKKNFILVYKQTILGPLWILLKPFLTSVVFTFIFGGIAGMSTDGVPQICFYMAGNTIWALFATCMTDTARTFTANVATFGKVYYPRLTVPISSMLTSFINFLIQGIMLIIFILYFTIKGSSITITNYIFLLPIIILQMGILGMTMGMIVAAVTTKYRDLAIALDFFVQIWLYLTPIAYPLSQTSGIIKQIVLLNPLTMPVELFRHSILGVGEINFGYWSGSIIFTIISLIVSIILFNKVEKTFIDVV